MLLSDEVWYFCCTINPLKQETNLDTFSRIQRYNNQPSNSYNILYICIYQGIHLQAIWQHALNFKCVAFNEFFSLESIKIHKTHFKTHGHFVICAKCKSPQSHFLIYPISILLTNQLRCEYWFIVDFVVCFYFSFLFIPLKCICQLVISN